MARLAQLVPAPLQPLYGALKRFVKPLRCDAPVRQPHAALQTLSMPVVVDRSGTFNLVVRVRNLSASPWVSAGRMPVRLTARWLTSRQQPTNFAAVLIDLPQPLFPGGTIDVHVPLQAADAAGQYLLKVEVEQTHGPVFQGKPAWLDVQVVAPAVEEIDYHKVYATADLDADYWTVVGPPTQAEFHRLAKVKLIQLQEQGLTPDWHVLDVGCGTGQLAAGLEDYLSERGGYFGTDVGPEAIAFCQRKYTRPNFAFAVNDFTRLPVGDRKFDLATYFSVFTHTYPDETVLLLAETAKALKPGGIILGDVFTSPLTDRCAGNRGAVELNREHFLRLVALAGLRAETVASWDWKQHARREVMRFTTVTQS